MSRYKLFSIRTLGLILCFVIALGASPFALSPTRVWEGAGVRLQGLFTINRAFAQTDTDGDGLTDDTDLDDDNDGITDATENFLCLATAAITDKSAMSVTTDHAVTGNIATLLDNAQANTFYYNNSNITNKTLAEFTMGSGVTLTKIEITLGSSSSFLANNAQYRVEGWNGTAWVNLTGTLTSNGVADAATYGASAYAEPFNLRTNTQAYTKYRIYGISGTTSSSPWVYEAYFEQCTMLEDDVDGDGILNRLDLDSDGDGIPDNVEAQSTAGYVAPGATVDANGVPSVYSGGLALVNTDSLYDFVPDLFDTNSDEDRNGDEVEAGNVNAGASYSDVNGALNNGAAGLPNTHGASEVDFREYKATPRNTPIAAGGSHTCLITASGGVKCWGGSYLGNGASGASATPVDVIGVANVVSISAGSSHTCVLEANGGVKCWGHNAYYALGNGTTTAALTAQAVPGLTSGVAIIASGAFGNCAVLENGDLRCWGNVGTVATDPAFGTTPSAFGGVDNHVIDVNFSVYNVCVTFRTGHVKCAGYNHVGQLGNGTTTNSETTLVKVLGVENATAAAISQHVGCALLATGGMKCWGSNVYGQRGNPAATTAAILDVLGLNNDVVAIDSGDLHFCAHLRNGNVKCWGLTGQGQTGTGSNSGSIELPTLVVGVKQDVAFVAAGGNHTCLLMTNGSLNCTGDNSSSQLGDSVTNRDWFVPMNLSGFGNGSAWVPSAMSITKSAPNPNPPVAGQPVAYTIDVVNTSSTPLNKVTVVDLPSTAMTMTTFTSTPAGACDLNTRQCTLNEPLLAGATATFHVGFNTSVVVGAIISNTAYAYADEAPISVYPDGPTQVMKSVAAGGSAGSDLAVTKTTTAAQATSGTPLNYTITVTNHGPNAATNVVATDVLPAGFTFNSATASNGGACSESGGAVTCSWASLANGSSVTATINVTP